MVAETLAPGSSVTIVARRHDVNTNQLFKWRRELLPKAVPAVVDAAMPGTGSSTSHDHRVDRPVRLGTSVLISGISS